MAYLCKQFCPAQLEICKLTKQVMLLKENRKISTFLTNSLIKLSHLNFN